MSYKDTAAKLAAYRREISTIGKKIRELQATIEPEEVRDYELSTIEGTLRLSELFAAKKELIVIHNMGTSCAYCTLWADGYNGIYDHLANRAAFVIASPDLPVAQQKFAESRGWRFRMVSHHGTSFARDLGYETDRGQFLPGLSVFTRVEARVQRVADALSSPGDPFCALWHIFDLLPEGAGDWIPRIDYSR